MKRKILIVIFTILTLSIMIAIFFFSSQNARSSSDVSNSVVKIILSIFVKGFGFLSEEEKAALISRLSTPVRKCAHFSIFASLGFSFTTLLSLLEVKRKKIVSPVFGFLYALSDELHQLFSSGRACSFPDVLIDTSGFVSGFIISLLIFCLFKRKSK